jgi:hypothetical protein
MTVMPLRLIRIVTPKSRTPTKTSTKRGFRNCVESNDGGVRQIAGTRPSDDIQKKERRSTWTR